MRAEEGMGEDNEEMTSLKGRFKPTTEKECSQWLVKGKEGNECMGVGESALYSLDCQFTSKLPLSPPDQPDPFEMLLLWLQSAYENTTADRVGVRVAR